MGSKPPPCVNKVETAYGILHVVDQPLMWPGSVEWCRERGAELATLPDQQAVRAIADQLKECVDILNVVVNRHRQMWRVGLMLYNGEGSWSDGTTYDSALHDKLFNRYRRPTAYRRCQETYLVAQVPQLRAEVCEPVYSKFLCLQSKPIPTTTPVVPTTTPTTTHQPQASTHSPHPNCKNSYPTRYGELTVYDNPASLSTAVEECALSYSILPSLTSSSVINEIASMLHTCHGDQTHHRSSKHWRIGLRLYDGNGFWSNGLPYHPAHHEDLFEPGTTPAGVGCQDVVLMPDRARLAAQACYNDEPFLCLTQEIIKMATLAVNDVTTQANHVMHNNHMMQQQGEMVIGEEESVAKGGESGGLAGGVIAFICIMVALVAFLGLVLVRYKQRSRDYAFADDKRSSDGRGYSLTSHHRDDDDVGGGGGPITSMTTAVSPQEKLAAMKNSLASLQKVGSRTAPPTDHGIKNEGAIVPLQGSTVPLQGAGSATDPKSVLSAQEKLADMQRSLAAIAHKPATAGGAGSIPSPVDSTMRGGGVTSQVLEQARRDSVDQTSELRGLESRLSGRRTRTRSNSRSGTEPDIEINNRARHLFKNPRIRRGSQF